jgi:translation initiation factor IF-1
MGHYHLSGIAQRRILTSNNLTQEVNQMSENYGNEHMSADDVLKYLEDVQVVGKVEEVKDDSEKGYHFDVQCENGQSLMSKLERLKGKTVRITVRDEEERVEELTKRLGINPKDK